VLYALWRGFLWLILIYAAVGLTWEGLKWLSS